jgi:hypothetical protein
MFLALQDFDQSEPRLIVGFEPFFPSKFGHQDSTRYSKYKRAKIGQNWSKTPKLSIIWPEKAKNNDFQNKTSGVPSNLF